MRDFKVLFKHFVGIEIFLYSSGDVVIVHIFCMSKAIFKCCIVILAFDVIFAKIIDILIMIKSVRKPD